MNVSSSWSNTTPSFSFLPPNLFLPFTVYKMSALRSFRDKVDSFQNKRVFNPVLKTKVHCVTTFLVIVVIVVTGVRIQVKPAYIPVSRSDTISIVMVSPPLIIILYLSMMPQSDNS